MNIRCFTSFKAKNKKQLHLFDVKKEKKNIISSFPQKDVLLLDKSTLTKNEQFMKGPQGGSIETRNMR